MKKTITIITLIIGLSINAMAAKDTVDPPLQVEFANKLVDVFGGKDKNLSQAELVRVLQFLQANLPESTQPTNMVNRLSRENNFYNAPRGELTEERYSVRDLEPEMIVGTFLKKYDTDKDAKVNNTELAVALENVIGTPKARTGLGNGNIAKK